MERFYKKVFLATKECFKIIEESLKCIQGINLNVEVTWFVIKTCCYDARTDKGTSQKYEIMLETCSGGITYPRTNRVWHETVPFKNNRISRFREQLCG